MLHHSHHHTFHSVNLVTPSSSSRLFLLVLAGTLGLGGTSELLGAVLPLFALLSAGLFDLGGLAHSDQSVVGFEFLKSLDTVVDEGETGGFAAAVVCAQTEDVDLVFVGFVHLGQLSPQVVLGHVGSVWVQNVTVWPKTRASG